MVVIPNVTQPNVDIDPGIDSSFSLSIIEMGEKDATGNIVSSYQIPEVSFEREYSEEGKNRIYNYSASLSNAAFMSVIVS